MSVFSEKTDKTNGIMRQFCTTNANLVMQAKSHGKIGIPTVQNTGDAVGVEQKHWFVAVVNNNTEKASGEKLHKLGYQCYVPTQTERRVWENGKRVTVNRVVIPTVVFVQCSDEERKQIVALPFINRFMVNRASESKTPYHKPLAIVPNEQINVLKYMLEQSDIPISFTNHIEKGDIVRVARGRFAGIVGSVTRCNNGKLKLTVQIDFLGGASVEVGLTDIEKL